MILHLGCVLGRLGSLLGRLVGVKPIIPRSRSTKIEDLRHLGLLARPLWASAGCLGSSWGLLGRLASVLGMAWAFGGFLKLFWAVLGASWEWARRLGSLLGRPSCGRLGDGLKEFGWQLGPSWGRLARLGCILGASWGEASRKLIGPSSIPPLAKY